ncbi:hypothetical protein PLICRDRAFT_36113 [Plicaturopsis crispa FD-325 SS-3]|nr:hypothetical protein PLICRDRAFT_36113 [Plicaturopsis crispa FD-325 SS-3]
MDTDIPAVEEKQCRICLDGPDPDSGRLIRPCLCRGSMTYVHVQCLQKWRTSSGTSNHFECPVCKYRYRYARTRVLGIATNPVVIGAVSFSLFTFIVLCSSFITTFFMNAFDTDFEEPSYTTWYSSYYVSPFSVGHDLVRAAYRILTDQGGIFDEDIISRPSHRAPIPAPVSSSPGLFRRLFQRFLLGLPVVGAGSVIHLLWTVQTGLLPLQWLARRRGDRRRGNDNRDVAALVIVALLVVGSARVLYKMYQVTQRTTQKLLTRAEDAILEVGGDLPTEGETAKDR